jgi:NAD-dependent dihydropyrimidine dehydrogenase PreA subunit
MVQMPEIIRELCNGCGLCVTVCSHNGLVLINNMAVVIETVECDYCTLCEAVCPTGAIRCPFEIVVEEC